MSHISAHVRLRPIRFAFLVRPDDKARVHEIFRISTCLWGGRFNPIIPIFKQVPSWWDRHGHRFESARQIATGYLDYFEPDFLVEAEAGLALGLGFSDDRVFSLDEILARAGSPSSDGHGLSVDDLYADLYKKDYRFASRETRDIVGVVTQRKSFAAFGACVFGAFPEAEGLRHFGDSFREVFSPREVELDGKTCAELYGSEFTTALRIGQSGIRVRFANSEAPAIFVMDATQARDLIDFWNLRAVRPYVFPVPYQWLGEMSAFCKSLIEHNYRPLPGNTHGVMIRPTVMFARSIDDGQIKHLYEDHLRVDVQGANTLQDWYPPLWRPTPDFVVEHARPELMASEKHFEFPVNSDGVEAQFQPLFPEFASEYGSERRWANVVRLKDWTHKDQIAVVYPTDCRESQFPKIALGREPLLSTTEGLVVFPRFRNLPERWELSDGTTSIRSWLKKYGVESSQSDAGKVTQQIIQTLGGFWGVASFAHPEIVKLLNDVSRRPGSKSIQHQHFRNRINDFVKGDHWRHKNFENLVERKAVELGLELNCSKCSHWSWHSLKQLDYRVTCDLCLREFDFPIVEPSIAANSKWAYRLIGPFALPDFARGGYAASLSIRFFSELLGRFDSTSISWSGGLELKLPNNTTVEADFVLWFQRRGLLRNDKPTEVVFGESKSFGKDAFQADDVERMKSLAVQFPGSILVFSTMKPAAELSKSEVDRLIKLALWGREYSTERRQSRAPIVILTGTELFAPYAVSSTWKELGGKHAELSEPGWINISNLRTLADLTQQLYLDLPSYSSWREEKWKKRMATREARASKPAI